MIFVHRGSARSPGRYPKVTEGAITRSITACHFGASGSVEPSGGADDHLGAPAAALRARCVPPCYILGPASPGSPKP